MLSIGELIDKLIIENIKISVMKEKLNNASSQEDKEYVIMYQKMMDLNTNRAIIHRELDAKIERVVKGEEKNSILKVVKTYA